MTFPEFIKSILKKLQSVKVWITLWAIVIITIIVVLNLTNFTTLSYILSAVPLSYMGINVMQDYIFKN